MERKGNGGRQREIATPVRGGVGARAREAGWVQQAMRLSAPARAAGCRRAPRQRERRRSVWTLRCASRTIAVNELQGGYLDLALMNLKKALSGPYES